MQNSNNQIDRRINNFAARSFRDMGDGDYIAARMACRSGLMPQFLWSAQQMIEKYLKYILLVNRIEAGHVRHDINVALRLAQSLPFELDLQPGSKEFIEHIAKYGEYRYLDVSYHVDGYALVELDRAAWDLRRYCQVLDVRGKILEHDEQRAMEIAQEAVRTSADRRPQLFRIEDGLLEGILDSKLHPARKALVWQNAFFGKNARRTVTARDYMEFANSPLYLFPEMLEELAKYVFIPKDLKKGYREHLKAMLADPRKRP